MKFLGIAPLLLTLVFLFAVSGAYAESYGNYNDCYRGCLQSDSSCRQCCSQKKADCRSQCNAKIAQCLKACGNNPANAACNNNCYRPGRECLDKCDNQPIYLLDCPGWSHP